MMNKKSVEYNTPSFSTNLFLGYCMFQEILPDAGYSGKYNKIWAPSLLVETDMQISKCFSQW